MAQLKYLTIITKKIGTGLHDKRQRFHTKEMLQMVLEKLEEVDNKLENKLDKTEFYTVLGLLVAIGGVVAAIVM